MWARSGVPEGILYKPGTLTAAEFEVVKAHTTVGAQLLSGGQSAILRMAETVALTHHERWDGSGYPQGLKGLNIPIEGRIMAVADTYDALDPRPHPPPRLVESRSRDRNQPAKRARRSTRGWSRHFWGFLNAAFWPFNSVSGLWIPERVFMI